MEDKLKFLLEEIAKCYRLGEESLLEKERLEKTLGDISFGIAGIVESFDELLQLKFKKLYNSWNTELKPGYHNETTARSRLEPWRILIHEMLEVSENGSPVPVSTSLDKSKFNKDFQIYSEYSLRNALIGTLILKGYPENSFHPNWKQDDYEFDLVILEPETRDVLAVFLCKLSEQNPVVVSSSWIESIINKFASLDIPSRTQLFLVGAVKGKHKIDVSKILTHTRKSRVPIFIKMGGLGNIPDFQTLKNNESGALGISSTKSLVSANANRSVSKLSDKELLEIISLAENSNIPSSRYQRAHTEWQNRYQQKNGGIKFEVGGIMINHGVINAESDASIGISVTGNNSSTDKTKITHGKTSTSSSPDSTPRLGTLERFTNNQTFAVVVGGIILLVILYVLYRYTGINLQDLHSK